MAIKLVVRRGGVTEEDFVTGNQFGVMYQGRHAIIEIVGVSDDHLMMRVVSGGEGEDFEIRKDVFRHQGGVQVLQARI